MDRTSTENPFALIERRFNQLEAILMEIKSMPVMPPTLDEEIPLNVEAAAKLLGISKQTVYQNIERIPHKKRFGKLYFFRNELLAFLKDGESCSEWVGAKRKGGKS
jgi:hypothetical protein